MALKQLGGSYIKRTTIHTTGAGMHIFTRVSIWKKARSQYQLLIMAIPFLLLYPVQLRPALGLDHGFSEIFTGEGHFGQPVCWSHYQCPFRLCKPFSFLLMARIIPDFLHPVYFSVAFGAAATMVTQDQVTKANSKIFMGVTAGMVIGTPIARLIADSVSLEASLWFFAIVNAIAWIAILIFIPSMPVKEKQSYGSQLSILRKSLVWLSILTVILINSAMYALHSYFAEYLDQVTGMSGKQISMMLVLFGLTGMLGNIIAGSVLQKKAMSTAVVYPFIFGAIYLLVYLLGDFTGSMMFLIAICGVLFTLGLNISQYWITSAAPEALEFTNGLFVAFANLGITIGTFIGGLFISGGGTRHVVWAGVIFLALSLVTIAMRALIYSPKKVNSSLSVKKLSISSGE